MKTRPFTFWRVRPLPGEAANSYFSRLVADECNYLPRAYASEVGLAHTFRSDELLAAIDTLPISQEDKTRLRCWTPQEAGGRIHLAGQEFLRTEFRWTRKLECTACVREVPYHRVWWHLACFNMCPVHGRPLQPLEYESLTVGRHFPRFEAVAAERLPHVELGEVGPAFESHVIATLLRPQSGRSPKYVAHLAEACEFLGRLLGNPRQPVVPPHTLADLARGYELLTSGTEGVSASVRQWLESNGDPLPAVKLGHLLGWAAYHLETMDRPLDPLMDNEPNPLLDEVANIVRCECQRLLGSGRHT